MSDNPQRMPFREKVFNDPVHGHISMHPLCVRIIDTPEFQRLRFIKQVGPVYFVYPGAAHNRFEHSLGVCHLAGKFIHELEKKQDLGITKSDIMCIKIAGLCHSLGHGPFSRVFEKFIAKALKRPWKHEDASVAMFDHIVKKYNMKHEFIKYDDFHEEEVDKDIEFIKELISGNGNDASTRNEERTGRPKEKHFLYEIVKNTRNGIDVDKWDRIARDCLMLGMSNPFDHDRCMQLARVIPVEGDKQICFREKESGDIYDMFYQRMKLHRMAYQHKISFIIGEMLVEAFLKANDHIKFKGDNGQEKTMSKTIEDKDMTAFCHITDEVIQHIRFTCHEGLKDAKGIIENILSRKLYTYVDQIQPKYNTYNCYVGKEQGLVADIAKIAGEGFKDKIVIQVVNLDFGLEDQNPVQRVRFYSKTDPDTAFPEKEAIFRPQRFLEQVVRVFCKESDKSYCEQVKKAFRVRMTDKTFKNGNLPPNPPTGGHQEHDEGMEVAPI